MALRAVSFSPNSHLLASRPGSFYCRTFASTVHLSKKTKQSNNSNGNNDIHKLLEAFELSRQKTEKSSQKLTQAIDRLALQADSERNDQLQYEEAVLKTDESPDIAVKQQSIEERRHPQHVSAWRERFLDIEASLNAHQHMTTLSCFNTESAFDSDLFDWEFVMDHHPGRPRVGFHEVPIIRMRNDLVTGHSVPGSGARSDHKWITESGSISVFFAPEPSMAWFDEVLVSIKRRGEVFVVSSIIGHRAEALTDVRPYKTLRPSNTPITKKVPWQVNDVDLQKYLHLEHKCEFFSDEDCLGFTAVSIGYGWIRQEAMITIVDDQGIEPNRDAWGRFIPRELVTTKQYCQQEVDVFYDQYQHPHMVRIGDSVFTCAERKECPTQECDIMGYLVRKPRTDDAEPYEPEAHAIWSARPPDLNEILQEGEPHVWNHGRIDFDFGRLGFTSFMRQHKDGWRFQILDRGGHPRVNFALKRVKLHWQPSDPQKVQASLGGRENTSGVLDVYDKPSGPIIGEHTWEFDAEVLMGDDMDQIRIDGETFVAKRRDGSIPSAKPFFEITVSDGEDA